MRQRTILAAVPQRQHEPGLRVTASPTIVVAVVVVLACVADLVLTLIVLAGGRSPGTLLAAPLTAEVLLLGAIAVAGALAVARSRAVGAQSREAAAQAREDADRLLKVIDNTSAVIYLRDGDGHYLLVNRQYEQLFGVRRQDIVGLTDHDLFPAQMADEFRANDLRALAHGAPLQMEETAPHPDGPHAYITVKYPITDAAGRPYAICGISTDITILKRAEEKVRQLNAELEVRVRDRTAELEASTRELDAFAYSVSHDLRAPLRAVAGFSEVLVEDYADRLDETGRGYLDRVLAATDRMGQLIDDLLNLSRAARVGLTRRSVNLTALSYEVVEELVVADPEVGARAVITVDEGLRAVGDPALLKLVLQNLISNAVKFSSKKPTPRVRIGVVDRDGVSVFFVRDNGAGFDMRYADKLFTPFQRLHSFNDFAGSGIGLAIVGRIIARHGGRIWAESGPGAGAEFHFTLPTSEGAQP